MNNFSLMARFNAWANERLYDSVSGLSEGAYKRDRKAFFGSIHNTLNHLLVVDRLWTGRIQETDGGIRGLDQILFDDFASLRAARISEDAALVALADGLSPSFFHPSISRRIYSFASSGERGEPCGMPRRLSRAWVVRTVAVWMPNPLPCGQKLVSTFRETRSSATIGPSLRSYLGNVDQLSSGCPDSATSPC